MVTVTKREKGYCSVYCCNCTIVVIPTSVGNILNWMLQFLSMRIEKPLWTLPPATKNSTVSFSEHLIRNGWRNPPTNAAASVAAAAAVQMFNVPTMSSQHCNCLDKKQPRFDLMTSWTEDENFVPEPLGFCWGWPTFKHLADYVHSYTCHAIRSWFLLNYNYMLATSMQVSTNHSLESAFSIPTYS